MNELERQASSNVKTTVIEKLKEEYSLGHLEIEEFETRLEAANMTDNKQVLVSLIEDLPSTQAETTTREVSHHQQHNDMNYFINVFSGMDRKGIWKPKRNIHCINIFGGGDLDFTEAIIPPEGIKIKAVNIFGGLDIIVPENVRVEVNAIPIFGGIDNKTNYLEDANTKVIHIDALCLFGGMDIKNRKRRRR